MKKAKKQNLIKVVVLALCLCFLTPFFSCANPYQTVKEGITVLPDKAQTYSKETLDFAYSALYGVGEEYIKLETGKELSDKNAKKLGELVLAVRGFTLQENLAESTYLEFYTHLKSRAQDYAFALYSFNKGTATQEQRALIKGVITKITSLWGAEVFASVFYQSVLYYYDYKYEDYLEKFQNYGLSVHKIEAEKALEDKQTLMSAVGKENFSLAVKLFYFTQGLLFAESFSQTVLGSFSPSEILLFIKEPNFSGLEMGASGWQLILSYAEIFISDGYYKDLFMEFEKSGDLQEFALKVQYGVKLLTLVQENLTEKGASAILQGDKNALLKEIFSAFREKEWALFENLTSITLTGDYGSVARDYYSIDYDDYLIKVKTYDLKALKSSVQNDNFADILIGYFAGICPALTYGSGL